MSLNDPYTIAFSLLVFAMAFVLPGGGDGDDSDSGGDGGSD